MAQVNFGEGLISALLSFIEQWTDKAANILSEVLVDIAELTVWTPRPEYKTPSSLLTKPSDPIWGQIWEIHWEFMIPLGLAILWGSYFARNAGQSFNLVSAERGAQSRKTAIKGTFILLFSWWLIGIYLNLVHGLALALIPEVAEMKSAVPDLTISTGVVGVAIYALEINFNILLLILLVLANVIRILGTYTFGMLGGFALAVSYARIPIMSGAFEKAFNKMATIPLWVLPVAAAWRVMVVLAQANEDASILETMLPGGILSSFGGAAESVVASLLITIPLIVGIASPLVMTDVQQLYYMKRLSGFSLGDSSGEGGTQYLDRENIGAAKEAGKKAAGGLERLGGGSAAAAGAAGRAGYEATLSEETKYGVESTVDEMRDAVSEQLDETAQGLGIPLDEESETFRGSVNDKIGGLFDDEDPAEFDDEEMWAARRDLRFGDMDEAEVEEEYGAEGMAAVAQETESVGGSGGEGSDVLTDQETTSASKRAAAWDELMGDSAPQPSQTSPPAEARISQPEAEATTTTSADQSAKSTGPSSTSPSTTESDASPNVDVKTTEQRNTAERLQRRQAVEERDDIAGNEQTPTVEQTPETDRRGRTGRSLVDGADETDGDSASESPTPSTTTKHRDSSVDWSSSGGSDWSHVTSDSVGSEVMDTEPEDPEPEPTEDTGDSTESTKDDSPSRPAPPDDVLRDMLSEE